MPFGRIIGGNRLADFADRLVWLYSLEYFPIAPTAMRRRRHGLTDVAFATVHDVETRTEYLRVIITERSPKSLIRRRLEDNNDAEIFAWVKWRQHGDFPRYLMLDDAGPAAREWLKDAVDIKPVE